MANIQPYEIRSIEERVEELERQILSKREFLKVYTPIVDNLSSSNSLLLSATSSREKIAMAVKRLSELQKYLDSTYDIVEPADIEAMYELVLLYEPVLRDNLELLQQINDLSSVLNSEHMKHVPDFNQRLEKLLFLNVENETAAIKQCADVSKLSAQYNGLITQISNALVRMDEIVTTCEIACKPKKTDE